MLPDSLRVDDGIQNFKVETDEEILAVSVRWDDASGGGPNRLSLTKSRYSKTREKYISLGALDEETAAQFFPHLLPLLPYQLTSAEGPLHYFEDTIFHAGNIKHDTFPSVSNGKARELDLARQNAVWPEATDDELCLPKAELEKLLYDRLPSLMARFKFEIEEIGFIY